MGIEKTQVTPNKADSKAAISRRQGITSNKKAKRVTPRRSKLSIPKKTKAWLHPTLRRCGQYQGTQPQAFISELVESSNETIKSPRSVLNPIPTNYHSLSSSRRQTKPVCRELEETDPRLLGLEHCSGLQDNLPHRALPEENSNHSSEQRRRCFHFRGGSISPREGGCCATSRDFFQTFLQSPRKGANVAP